MRAGKASTAMRAGTQYRFKVTTDRKVNFVLLSVFADGDVEIVRTKQGGFLEAGNHFLTPENSGAFLMTTPPTGEAKATEYFVLIASTEKFPPPVVVRSRHADDPGLPREGPLSHVPLRARRRREVRPVAVRPQGRSR